MILTCGWFPAHGWFPRVIRYTPGNLATTNKPSSRLCLEADFDFSSWFVWNKVAMCQIDGYFAEAFAGMDARSFRLAYTIRQHLDKLDRFGDYLVWTKAAIDAGQHTTSFYSQNVIDHLWFLISQVGSRSGVVYGPGREYNWSMEGRYLAMHTEDWWWDTQVWNRSWNQQVVSVSSADPVLHFLGEYSGCRVNCST